MYSTVCAHPFHPLLFIPPPLLPSSSPILPPPLLSHSLPPTLPYSSFISCSFSSLLIPPIFPFSPLLFLLLFLLPLSPPHLSYVNNSIPAVAVALASLVTIPSMMDTLQLQRYSRTDWRTSSGILSSFISHINLSTSSGYFANISSTHSLYPL